MAQCQDYGMLLAGDMYLLSLFSTALSKFVCLQALWNWALFATRIIYMEVIILTSTHLVVLTQTKHFFTCHHFALYNYFDLSLVHTSCECEANLDVTNSQRTIRSSCPLPYSFAIIAAKGGCDVKFASHSHSQKVWTVLQTC